MAGKFRIIIWFLVHQGEWVKWKIESRFNYVIDRQHEEALLMPVSSYPGLVM